MAKVRDRFYWLSMRKEIEEWCRRCIQCASCKGPRTRSRGVMQQYVVGAPFERIALDIAGPFPLTTDGNKYILVVMDYFSKWPEAYALPNQEAITVAEVLVTNWISRFGVPLEIHSDQGTNFESRVFQEVCSLLGMRKTRTTPLHPQSDGMVERFNRTMLEHLKKVVDDNQRVWDKHIPMFLMAYRSSVHSSTGQSPASVIFGREMRLPSDIKFGVPPSEPTVTMSDYAHNLRETLRKVHEQTRDNFKLSSDRMKTRYDLLANSKGFHPDDLVWFYNPKRQKGRCPKLQKNWEGPYKVITRLNDVLYRIRKGNRGKFKVVHLDRLAPYLDPHVDDSVIGTIMNKILFDHIKKYKHIVIYKPQELVQSWDYSDKIEINRNGKIEICNEISKTIKSAHRNYQSEIKQKSSNQLKYPKYSHFNRYNQRRNQYYNSYYYQSSWKPKKETKENNNNRNVHFKSWNKNNTNQEYRRKWNYQNVHQAHPVTSNHTSNQTEHWSTQNDNYQQNYYYPYEHYGYDDNDMQLQYQQNYSHDNQV
ncbi:hypothetical protein WDU94_003718 [Cyamophila willieti]